MKAAPRSVLLVPPLSAYGGILSMTLYWRNVRESLASLVGSELSVQAINPTAPWRAPGLRRRICQRLVLPRLVRRAVARELRNGRHPVVHVLDQHYAHLLPDRCDSVITCHDLDVLVSPQRGLRNGDERRRVRHLLRAGSIHAISESTARDVARFFPAAASRIVVNYYGLDPVFHRRPPAADAPHLAKLRTAGQAAFVLHVGSNVTRKNIPVLLEGFAQARTQYPSLRLKLVKVGNDLAADGFGAMIEALGLAFDIIHLGMLEPAQLVDVYNSCRMFAFPSRYEGFGRPVAEAQACGLACILAATSSLPEVGGDAALYHATDSPPQLARHIIAVATDRTLRERLVVAGLENSRRFTWSRHAELLAASYLGLSAAPPGAHP